MLIYWSKLFGIMVTRFIGERSTLQKIKILKQFNYNVQIICAISHLSQMTEHCFTVND